MNHNINGRIGIWGPIAIDQYYIEGSDIHFYPKWGGCGLNQAIVIDKLCGDNKEIGAFLLSSIGPDFYEKKAEFQGYSHREILSLLPHIKNILHKSDKPTTSWDIPVDPPSDKQLQELRNRIGDEKTLRRIEATLYQYRQQYKPKGTSISDLEDSRNVDTLLKELETYGFPPIMSLSGGTPKMYSTVINAIKNYKKPSSTMMYYDPGWGFYESPDTVIDQLSRVSILRTNRDERYLLASKDKGVQDVLTKYPNLMAIITTKETEINTYVKHSETERIINAVEFGMAGAYTYLKQKRENRRIGVPRFELTKASVKNAKKMIRRQERPYEGGKIIRVKTFGLPLIKRVETTGAGDVFSASLLFNLAEEMR